MISLPELAHYSTDFPDPAQALTEPNGLLAFGGDLSVERLENAYRRGIFPWFSANEPILWWSPDPRGVLPLDALYISKTTRKWLNKSQHSITINHAFDAVITACAAIPRGPIIHDDGSIVENGTWISHTMVNAYQSLHKAKLAHSIEIWDPSGQLVGGLYGIGLNGVFCGESMFHTQANTSKLAFIALVHHMQQYNGAFIDCQMQNPYLASMGVLEVSRHEYLKQLYSATDMVMPSDMWQPQGIIL